MFVPVGDGVKVGVVVAVFVGVGVAVGAGVIVGVFVGVGVGGVNKGSTVGVFDGVVLGRGVRVAVGVRVGVDEGNSVAVLVGLAVSVAAASVAAILVLKAIALTVSVACTDGSLAAISLNCTNPQQTQHKAKKNTPKAISTNRPRDIFMLHLARNYPSSITLAPFDFYVYKSCAFVRVRATDTGRPRRSGPTKTARPPQTKKPGKCQAD